MKSRLLRSASVLPLLFAGPAIAADMALKAPPPAPPAPVFSWTGFYVGLNAGGAWASADPATSASCVPALGFPMSYLPCIDVAPVGATGTGSLSSSSFIGGAQAGYNWQSNNAVFGAELDIDSFHVRASRHATTFYTGLGSTFTVANSVSADWLFTARARLGWAFAPNLLAYATGGLALTDLGSSNTFTDPGINQSWSGSTTKVGWTVGGGLEWALNRNWSVKAEYLYVKFDSVKASGFLISRAVNGYANAISTSTDLTANIARAGVNSRF